MAKNLILLMGEVSFGDRQSVNLCRAASLMIAIVQEEADSACGCSA
jgi:hypothetical protein